MTRRFPVLLFTLLLHAAVAPAQTAQVLLDFRATGYEFIEVKSNHSWCSTFWKLNAAHTGWSTGYLGKTGNAAFGTINNTSSPPCPLNTPDVVKTTWPSSRDLLIRKKVSIPAGARDVVIQLALDNQAHVYFNGVRLTGSWPVVNDGCATLDDPALRFTVPNDLLKSGDNFLAIQGIWVNSKSFLDVRVTGKVSFTVTTTVTGDGSITPASPTEVLSGGAYSATYTAGTGHRIGSITRNGIPVTLDTTRLTPETFTLNIPSVTSNQQIAVAFVPKRFRITALAGENGSVTPQEEYVLYGDSSGGTVVQAGPGYHVEEVTATPPPTTLFSASQPTSAPASWPGPGGPYVFKNVSSDITVTASFAINNYLLTYAAGPNGSVELIGATAAPLPNSSYYPHGTIVTLRAVAADGFFFDTWTGVTPADEMSNPLAVTMDADRSIAATFAVLPDPVLITVGNLDDNGPGSLRQAILDANAAAGAAAIVFQGGLGGTITLQSPLPILSDVTSIDGGTGPDGQPLITVLQPQAGFTGNPSLPDGFTLSGLFLPFGYTPHGSTIRNLTITGFPGAGVCIGSSNNTIQGCVITENAGDGVCIIDGSNNLIGGTLPGQANAIFQNGENGVVVKKSAAATGFPAGNGILGNSIYENAKLGIDLGGTGVSLNRYPALPAAGSPRPPADRVNYGQAFPDLRFASVAGLDPLAEPSEITGKLYGWPGGSFRVEIYLDSLGDASGSGEGKRLIAVRDFNDPDPVVTDASGVASFTIASTVPLLGGEFISATATDDMNNTSEFSPAILAGTLTRVYGATDLSGDSQGRFVVNTTFSGVPLHFPDGTADVSISSSIPSHLQDAITAAYTTWEGLTGLPNGVSIDFSAGQPAASPLTWGGLPDGVNHVVSLSSNWEETTGSSEFALAVTRVRYNALTGAITDADIALNDQFFDFAVLPQPPGPTLPYDAQAVATHEFGHLLGLGDQYNRGDPGANLFHGATPCNEDVTMYGIVKDTDTYQRNIYPDDIKGLSFIYGYVPRSAVELMLILDGSQSFADVSTINGFEPSRDAAVELVDKVRDGDRVGVYLMSGASTFPMTTIDALTRENLKLYLNGLTPDATDTRPLGTALAAVAGQFIVSDDVQRAVIVYSAGNETGTTSALDQSVLNTLQGKEIRTFTMGFDQSPQGANLSSLLADSTGGAFYEAVDTAISTITNQIWTLLAGYQLVGDSTMPSDAISYQGRNQLAISFQGIKNNAISWQSATKNTAISYQGRIDAATTSIFPAISYQGRGGSVAKAAASDDPRFVLALVPPDVDPNQNWQDGVDPESVITPFNVGTYAPHVVYVQGETYAFYEIKESYPRRKDGLWKLVPVGDMNALPAEPIPVRVFLAAATDVVMNVTFDRSNYAIGQPITASLVLESGGTVVAQHTVGGSRINGAEVYALITPPGQADADSIPLAFSGNGVYTLRFDGTGAGGNYDFTFIAKGATPQGQPFSRQLDQSAYVLPAYSNAALFAAENVTLSDNAWVKSGDILVNRDAAPADPGFEFLAGAGVRTPAGFDIKADRVKIGAGSVIGGNVYTNQLMNAGTISGTVTSSLALPVDVFPPFEPALQAVWSAPGVWVPLYGNGGTLPPGTYGLLRIGYKGKLTLTTGTYHFKALDLEDGAKLYFTGTARVHVRLGVEVDDNAVISPVAGGGATASDLTVYVQGTDPECGHGEVVSVDCKASVSGTFYAPNGTIKLNQEAKSTGALLARAISIGKFAQVTLASAFSPLARIAAGTEGDESQDGVEAELPLTYELSQNFPNPFNPSTTIMYALPAPGAVSLIVYDGLGREVTRLVDNEQSAGYHTVQWTGANAAGQQVSTGVYFYRLQVRPLESAGGGASGSDAGDFTQIRKMLLVK